MRRIVDQIVSRRRLLGLTQTQLAGFSALSLPTIQNIEGRKANPSWTAVVRIMGVLGLELEWVPFRGSSQLLNQLLPWHECPIPPKCLDKSRAELDYLDQESHYFFVSLKLNWLAHEDTGDFDDENKSSEKVQLLCILKAIERYFPSVFDRELKASLTRSPVLWDQYQKHVVPEPLLRGLAVTLQRRIP